VLRVALGFANHAGLAQNNLGFRIVESILTSRGDLALERFFLPPGGLPPGPGRLRTEPSGISLAAADLVLFSLSFEGDALHIPALLAGGGLPVAAAARRRGHPLVAAGGAAVMINPEPIARFFDVFLVGEAEELLARFLDRWQPLRLAPREDLLAALDELPGALAPALREHHLWSVGGGRLRAGGVGMVAADGGGLAGAPRAPLQPKQASDPVETVKWQNLSETVVAARLPPEAHFRESLLLELERGCPRRCRFCVASRIYAPLRLHDPRQMVGFVERELRPGERIGLLGLSAGDYRHLDRLTEELSRCGWRLSISSLPADFRRPRAAASLVASGATTLTIAPESGTDRLRALAGKGVRNEAILETVRLLGAAGMRELRTYFLIGLPFEEPDDLAGIPRLLAGMRGALPGGCRLSATINPFVPKPRTPFQWAGMAPARQLEQAVRRLRRDAPAGVHLRIKSLREARTHAILTRADVSWGVRIERASLESRSFSRQLGTEGATLEDWTAPIEPGSPLPWGYLISARETGELEREWQAARREAGFPEAPA
jgi:radical SAM superfamily enzyme YgiQ (UPF0313 family)